jgi:hypothetical protein
MPLVDDPDEIITCDPGYCDGCGADVSGAPAVGMQRRQVVDVPACAAGQTALDGISTNSARAGPLAAVQSYLSTATKWGLLRGT